LHPAAAPAAELLAGLLLARLPLHPAAAAAAAVAVDNFEAATVGVSLPAAVVLLHAAAAAVVQSQLRHLQEVCQVCQTPAAAEHVNNTEVEHQCTITSKMGS
jgi:hypothetical protein